MYIYIYHLNTHSGSSSSRVAATASRPTWPAAPQYLRTTLWVIKALGGEGFQFSRAFFWTFAFYRSSLWISNGALAGAFTKDSLELPRDVTGVPTGAFPAELALEFALELTLAYVKRKRLRLRTSDVSAYAVFTLAYVKHKRLRCPCVSLRQT